MPIPKAKRYFTNHHPQQVLFHRKHPPPHVVGHIFRRALGRSDSVGAGPEREDQAVIVRCQAAGN